MDTLIRPAFWKEDVLILIGIEDALDPGTAIVRLLKIRCVVLEAKASAEEDLLKNLNPRDEEDTTVLIDVTDEEMIRENVVFLGAGNDRYHQEERYDADRQPQRG
jgi:hypothetical protein